MPINIPDDTPKDQGNKSIFAGVRDSGGSTLFAPFRAAVVTTLNGIATAALETYDATIATVLGSKADSEAPTQTGSYSIVSLVKGVFGTLGNKEDGYQPGYAANSTITQNMRGILYRLQQIFDLHTVTNTRVSSVEGKLDTLIAATTSPGDSWHALAALYAPNDVKHGTTDTDLAERVGLRKANVVSEGPGTSLLVDDGGDMDYTSLPVGGQSYYLPTARFSRTVVKIENNTNEPMTLICYGTSAMGGAYQLVTLPSSREFHQRTQLNSVGISLAAGASVVVTGITDYLIGDSNHYGYPALNAGGWGYLEMNFAYESPPTSGGLTILAVRS